MGRKDIDNNSDVDNEANVGIDSFEQQCGKIMQISLTPSLTPVIITIIVHQCYYAMNIGLDIQ